MLKAVSPKILFYLILSVALILSSYAFKKYVPENRLFSMQDKQETKQLISHKKPGLKSFKHKLGNSGLNSNMASSSGLLNEASTITEKTTRDLLLAYIANKQKGKNTKDIEDLIEKESQKLFKVQYSKYTEQDLKISKDFSLTRYRRQMQNALMPLTKIKEYELDTVALIIDKQDKDAMRRLKEDEELYTESINRLLQIPVNKDLLTPQLALINAYSKFLASLQLIEETKNDIILVYPALKMFLEADSEIYSAFDALKIYVELNQNR